MSVEAFDAAFDAGEDVDHLIDWSSARRINGAAKRVNVDFPLWMVRGLDAQAKKRGVTRQALIKMWLADRLEDVELAAIVRERAGQEEIPVNIDGL